MKRLALLLALVWVAVVGPAVHAQTGTLTESEFWQKVEATRAALRALNAGAPEALRPGLRVLAAEWAAVQSVRVGGQTIPLATQRWVQALEAVPPDLDYLDRELASLQAARERWPAPRHTAHDVAKLQPILARPEFQWDAPLNPFQEWWRSVLEWLQNWLNSYLPTNSAGAEIFNWIVTIGAAVALALILVYVLRGLNAGFSAEAQLRAEQAEEPLTSEAALSRAQNFSAAGDYRTAARFIYLAALLKLDERGLLRYDRSLTNREYVRRVSHKPQLAENLREVVEVFDRVWYGFQPLDAASYAAYARRVDELERLT